MRGQVEVRAGILVASVTLSALAGSAIRADQPRSSAEASEIDPITKEVTPPAPITDVWDSFTAQGIDDEAGLKGGAKQEFDEPEDGNRVIPAWDRPQAVIPAELGDSATPTYYVLNGQAVMLDLDSSRIAVRHRHAQSKEQSMALALDAGVPVVES